MSGTITVEQFRIQLQGVNPAELTKADRLALLDLFQQSKPK